MGMLIGDYDREISAAVGMASAADVYTFFPGGPVEIVRFGIIAATSSGFIATATSSFSLVGDTMTKTSATAGYTRTSAGVGTMTTTTSVATGQSGNGVYTDTSSPIHLDVGEHAIFQVTGVSSAGATARVFVEFRHLPWQGHGRPTTVPGDGTPSGNIVNMTKV